MTTRDAALQAVARYFDKGGFRDELAERVAIRTSSREESHSGDLMRYLDVLMRARFEAFDA